MDTNELIDKILFFYIAYNNDQKLFFVDICYKYDSSLTEPYIKKLQKRLEADGFLLFCSGDGEPMLYTSKAISHLESGGFAKQKELSDRKELIDKEKIEKFQRDKWSFKISLFAVVFSAIALAISIITLIHKW